jgi:hypothetical protein
MEVIKSVEDEKHFFLNHFNLSKKSGDELLILKHYIIKQYLMFG